MFRQANCLSVSLSIVYYSPVTVQDAQTLSLKHKALLHRRREQRGTHPVPEVKQTLHM